MQFNKFSMYSFQAGNLQGACDDKFLVDIQRLHSIHELEDVRQYLIKTFGDFEEDIAQFECPNNLSVYIEKLDSEITVEAIKDNQQIFGKRWRLENAEDV